MKIEKISVWQIEASVKPRQESSSFRPNIMSWVIAKDFPSALETFYIEQKNESGISVNKCIKIRGEDYPEFTLLIDSSELKGGDAT